MRVILGLGNPGTQYVGTRHNVGMTLVERIFNFQFSIFKNNYGWRRKKDIFVAKFPGLSLVKTAGVFMNESGRMIYDLRFMNYELSSLYVAHDDLDLQLGEYKIQKGVGPKLHYGLQSIESHLGHKDFWRIRIGVDNRDPSNRISGEEYVLQRFTADEKKTIDQVLDKICDQLDKS